MLAAVESALAGRYRDLRRRRRRLARRPDAGAQKIKKDGGASPALALVENPDILATIAHRNAGRPALVVGFAAETQNVIEHAKAKLARRAAT